MKSATDKREQEKRIVGQMIHLFCRKRHHQAHLCPDCQAVLAYAADRCDHCMEKCREHMPALVDQGNGRKVRCFLESDEVEDQ